MLMIAKANCGVVVGCVVVMPCDIFATAVGSAVDVGVSFGVEIVV